MNNIIIMKENFPTDGVCFAVGEQKGRYFFALGALFPREALQAFHGVVAAARIYG